MNTLKKNCLPYLSKYICDENQYMFKKPGYKKQKITKKHDYCHFFIISVISYNATLTGHYFFSVSISNTFKTPP